MNNSKSEDTVSPSHLSDSAVHDNRENSPAKKITPTYESTNFSVPTVDQLNGILPDFNNRLSPERNLGLSPSGQPRLSPENHPRLVSNSCIGLSTSQSQAVLPKKLEVPVGKGLEIRPSLEGKSLTGANKCSFIAADLPIAPLGSRIVTLNTIEEQPKSSEKKKSVEK